MPFVKIAAGGSGPALGIESVLGLGTEPEVELVRALVLVPDSSAARPVEVSSRYARPSIMNTERQVSMGGEKAVERGSGFLQDGRQRKVEARRYRMQLDWGRVGMTLLRS